MISTEIANVRKKIAQLKEVREQILDILKQKEEIELAIKDAELLMLELQAKEREQEIRNSSIPSTKVKVKDEIETVYFFMTLNGAEIYQLMELSEEGNFNSRELFIVETMYKFLEDVENGGGELPNVDNNFVYEANLLIEKYRRWL